jgi:hypothetical protein
MAVPAQKLTSFPAMTEDKPGALEGQNGGPLAVAVPAGGGTVTLNETTPVEVADARVTANSIIVLTLKTVGGTVGAQPVIDTITPGTGFTVKGSASDTSIYNYAILG